MYLLTKNLKLNHLNFPLSSRGCAHSNNLDLKLSIWIFEHSIILVFQYLCIWAFSDLRGTDLRFSWTLWSGLNIPASIIISSQYYWIQSNIIEYYWILKVIEYYWLSLNITEYHWILLHIIELYWILYNIIEYNFDHCDY